jgi:hypothetical protein
MVTVVRPPRGLEALSSEIAHAAIGQLVSAAAPLRIAPMLQSGVGVGVGIPPPLH